MVKATSITEGQVILEAILFVVKRNNLPYCQFCCHDLRLAAVVEGEGFKNLMKCIEPRYKVPLPTHVLELPKKKYVAARERLKDD